MHGVVEVLFDLPHGPNLREDPPHGIEGTAVGRNQLPVPDAARSAKAWQPVVPNRRRRAFDEVQDALRCIGSDPPQVDRDLLGLRDEVPHQAEAWPDLLHQVLRLALQLPKEHLDELLARAPQRVPAAPLKVTAKPTPPSPPPSPPPFRALPTTPEPIR